MAKTAIDILTVLAGGLLFVSFLMALCMPFIAIVFALGN
jgi:hypothetical protein